ncbi:NXPE family member 4-like [Babylonia areolata]|uniref:NXPE family member 4-like n=1 Tax=Babylonia areolata TaxID=304850 RepID=UPI003FCEF0C1
MWCYCGLPKAKACLWLCVACSIVMLVPLVSWANRFQGWVVWPPYQKVNGLHATSEVWESNITDEFCVWRPKAAEDGFYDTDENCLLPQLKQLGLKVSRGVGIRHEKPRTEYERWLLSTPPLTDLRLTADGLRSKVYVVSPKASHHIGDRIQIRVDLYNGYGQPRTSGGDEIRMRLLSKPGSASVAADVTDLRNGSYLGTTFLPWNGTASVDVHLAYPRELLREAARVRLSVHSTIVLGARYQTSSAKEVTACLPSSPIPGYGAVCNLTTFNGGLPYFCGRPTDKRLTCGHRKEITKLAVLKSFPLLPQARQMLRKILRGPFPTVIPNSIAIEILPAPESAERHQDLPPCWKRSPESTWTSTAPRGWMSADGVWRSFTCSLPRRVEHDHVRKCLRNTSLYFVGDSNLRTWWYELQRHLKCSRLSVGHDKHVHKVCEVRSSNTTMAWSFHGLPVYNHPVPRLVSLQALLERLRGDSLRVPQRRIVVVLHYFLHFSLLSPGVYQDRVRGAKRHIQQFLQEFPTTKFLIRGPHLNVEGVTALRFGGGDTFGPAYIQIWQDEFRELRDRVWFLDVWDMTVATQNWPAHPPQFVVREMVKVMLGHVCEGFP